MNRRATAAAAAILLLVLAGMAAWRAKHRAEAASPPHSSAAEAALRLRSGQARTPLPLAPRTPASVQHLADDLDAPGKTARDDVQLLAYVIDTYRTVLHGTNPVGDNAEITAVLAGGNRLGFEFISRRHPAINAAGELCDRWGTPYFFHQISGTQMQVRSAGPDRRMWTGDDIAAGP